jgi:hypothetical protein
VFEILDRIEAQQRELAANEPVPANALDFLQSIYRNPLQPLPVRIRCAVEALPFESPKLSATAVMTVEDFSERLDRAIRHSERPTAVSKLIPQGWNEKDSSA